MIFIQTNQQILEVFNIKDFSLLLEKSNIIFVKIKKN